jgi:hypothetical protein
MDWNVFDITKSIAILALVAFVWVKGSELVTAFSRPEPQPPQVIRIDENAIKLAAIEASDKRAQELKEEFARERSTILAAFEEQRKQTKEALDELGLVKSKLEQTRKLLQASTKTYDKTRQRGASLRVYKDI